MIPLLLLACAEAERPPLVVMVSLDTLRADRVGAYGNADGLTPNLDRLAAEGVVFERAYAAANETLYSHASLLSGRWASELAPLDDGFEVPKGTASLPVVLANYGWRSGAFVAGGHLARFRGLETGFEVYDDTASWGSLHDTVPRALRWLDEPGDAPRFLFVHGYDTHERYLKPTPFGYARADVGYAGAAREAVRGHGRTSLVIDGVLPARMEEVELHALSQPRPGRVPFAGEGVPFTPEDAAHVADVYDGAVAYADAWVGRLVAGLEARGLYDDATLIVLSDHGENLGEGGFFHHRYALSEETLHVPVLVRLPGGANAGRRVSDLVELTDVMPTVLALAGASPPAGSRGASLLPALDGSGGTGRTLTHAEGALDLLSVADGDARIVSAGLPAETPGLPTLLAVAPPNPATLVVTGDAARAEALRAALAEWRASVVVAPPGPSAKQRQIARDRGYWQATP